MLKLLSYLKPYWKSALLAPLCMLLEVIMDLFQPALMAKIINVGIANLDLDAIVRTGGLMLGVAFIGLLGGVGCTIFASMAAMNKKRPHHVSAKNRYGSLQPGTNAAVAKSTEDTPIHGGSVLRTLYASMIARTVNPISTILAGSGEILATVQRCAGDRQARGEPLG